MCSPADLPMGTALIVFSQTIGGAIAVAIGQNIFTNKLVENLKIYAPSLDAPSVLFVGATGIHKKYSGDVLSGVVKSYNEALTQVFLISAIMGAITVIGSAAMPWTNVKGKKTEVDAAEEGKKVEETDGESAKDVVVGEKPHV